MIELVVLIVVIAIVAFLFLSRGAGEALGTLVVNGILGVILIFLTNLVLEPDIPINILTLLICAIGGVVGWLIILFLHVLQLAF